MEKLKAFLNQHPKAKILDVGTGRGNFIELLDYLYKDYEKIVGIDIMDRLVEMAQKHFEGNDKVKIVKRDILDTGFPEEHFDIVCLSNTLHHLTDVAGTFQAMERLDKPGGFLLFNEMMKDNQNEKQQSHIMIHHFSAKIDRELGMHHDETMDRHEIVDMVKNNTSFEVIDHWDMQVEDSGESSPEEIEHMIKTVDILLMRLRDEEKTNKYKEEAETIKQYIKDNGIQACTQVLVTAQKNK